jgi:hypothetical protein
MIPMAFICVLLSSVGFMLRSLRTYRRAPDPRAGGSIVS